MKAKELVYLILDQLKITSDDSIINEGHVLFLCKKYRAFLIKKEQDKEKSSTDVASEFEYQEICLDLEKVPAMDGEPCTGGYYLRSTEAIPKILEGTQPRVYPTDFYQGTNMVYVSRDRMRYIGTNKYLQNTIYSSLGTDKHLYLNSSNPQFLYLAGEKKVRMSAIFEDFDEALKLSCNDGSGDEVICDALDADFPIREYLVPPLIELVMKQLQPTEYVPEDKANNASDDLSNVSRSK